MDMLQTGLGGVTGPGTPPTVHLKPGLTRNSPVGSRIRGTEKATPTTHYHATRPGTGRRPDLTALLFLLAVSFAMYGRTLMPGRVMSTGEILFRSHPWKMLSPGRVTVDPILNDPALVFQPWMVLAKREVSAGRFPLWNPYTYCGSPLLGAAQSALLCPFNALSYILPLETAIGLAAVLKTAVAGMSLYWFLRLLSIGSLPALAGSLAFMFGGFMTVWLLWPIASVAAWLPALFASVEKLRQEGGRRNAALVALVTFLHLLGGHPETSFQITLAAAAWAVYRARGPGGLRFLGLAAGGLLAGVLAAGVQLLPFLDYLSRSATARHWQGSLDTAIKWKGALLFLVPRYFGNRGEGTAWELPVSSDYNEVSGTVGILPLILAACAFIGARARPGTVFFAVAAALCAVTVYHEPFLPFTSFLPWLYSRIPLVSPAPHGRLLLFLGFSLSVLGATGMEALMRPGRAGRAMATAVLLVPAALAIVLLTSLTADYPAMVSAKSAMGTTAWAIATVLLLGAAGWTARRMAQGKLRKNGAAILVAIGFLSLAPFPLTFLPVMRSRDLFPETPALAFLKKDRDFFRVLMPAPNVGAVYGIHDILGRDAINPRLVTDLTTDRTLLGHRSGGAPLFTRGPDSPLLNLMNVRYLLLSPDAPPPGAAYKLVYSGIDARVYRNSAALPRALLVPSARLYRDGKQALADILEGRIDFRSEITLAGKKDSVEKRGATGTARITSYATDSVTVRTSAAGPAFLLLSDSYDPGWRARVDGRPAELLRADHAFRAVRLPAGEHFVDFLYRPASFILGLLLSALGIMMALLMALFPGRQR